jgi:hypothetical protein
VYQAAGWGDYESATGTNPLQDEHTMALWEEKGPYFPSEAFK